MNGFAGGPDAGGLRAAVAAMGASFDAEVLERTRLLYAPHVRAARPDQRVIADIAYGADPRQKLDLYLPARPSGPALVFVPGGGFTGGDKNGDGTFYGNLGRYFAGHGMLTAVINYRLSPAHPWPAGSEDVAGAVAWVRAHAGDHGGSGRTFLMGQSAGAAHAAGFLFNDAFHAEGGPGIDAAVLMSGIYRVGAGSPPHVRAYFGGAEAAFAERSPIAHAGRSRVPLMLCLAEFDPAPLAAPSFELAQSVTMRDGRSPHFAWFAGHNHVSTVMSLGTPQEDVGNALRDFLERQG